MFRATRGQYETIIIARGRRRVGHFDHSTYNRSAGPSSIPPPIVRFSSIVVQLFEGPEIEFPHSGVLRLSPQGLGMLHCSRVAYKDPKYCSE